MHKSTISAVTLITTAFCSMPAYLATSDSIFSAGLMSSFSSSSSLLLPMHQQEPGIDVGITNSEPTSAESHIYAHAFTLEITTDLPVSQFSDFSEKHSHMPTGSLTDRAWLPAKLPDFSQEEHAATIYVDSFEWDGGDELSEKNISQTHSFNFDWETDPMAGKSLVIKGLRQYLAVENEADFDFKVLRGRVINLSTDPLEYSIMNDLCFIKHCFF